MTEVSKGYTIKDIAGSIVEAHSEIAGETVSDQDSYQWSLDRHLEAARNKVRSESGEYWGIHRPKGKGVSSILLYDESHTAGILDALADRTDLTRRSASTPLNELGVTKDVIRRAEEILFQPQAKE